MPAGSPRRHIPAKSALGHELPPPSLVGVTGLAPIAAAPAHGWGDCSWPILLQKYVLQGAFRAEVIFLDSAEAMALRQPHVGAAALTLWKPCATH